MRSDNQRLREQIREPNRDRDHRAAAVALELEQLRSENRQLKAELREEIRAEIKAEYEGQINSLTEQLAEMTKNYQAVLARLTALEGAK